MVGVSPNLAFLCRNLDYKPYSINQSIMVGVIAGAYHNITNIDISKVSFEFI